MSEVVKGFLRHAFLLCFCEGIFTSFSHAAGVTIITHGYSGNVAGWVSGMAAQIPNYPGFPGTNATTYQLTLTTDGTSIFYQWTRATGGSPTNSDSGEIIIKLDWSQMAGGRAPYNISTYRVAAAASSILLQTNTIADLGGHALAEWSLHLIGHSRGGSLVSEMSRILGTNGVWVDHLTTLDPHPLNNDGNSEFFTSVVDASAKNAYANVLFDDNYWQKNNSFFGLDPSGESVNGAYDRQLNNLPGGYNNVSSVSPNHSNMHLWYHGTVQLVTPASDTEATITSSERTNWWVPYEQRGTNAGFYYSLIGGGDRTSMDIPLGLPGDPEIRDGYNQNWDLGGGTNANRTMLTANSGAWPNVIRFNLDTTNAIMTGDPVGVSLYYQYGGSSNLTLNLCLDRDFDPWNDNSVSVDTLQPPATGTNFVNYYPNLGLSTTNVVPGAYAVYAKITDGTRVRYLYAPELLTVVSSAQPPVLGISQLTATQFKIAINGVMGQTVVLQTSVDLQNWMLLATNTLQSSDWVITNSVPTGFGRQFYRARLAP